MAGQPTFSQKTQAIITIICLHRMFSGGKPKCAINNRSFSILFAAFREIAKEIPGIISYCDCRDLIQLRINLSRSWSFTPTAFMENKTCQVDIVL